MSASARLAIGALTLSHYATRTTFFAEVRAGRHCGLHLLEAEHAIDHRLDRVRGNRGVHGLEGVSS